MKGYIDDNTYTANDVAAEVLKMFVSEYEGWEDSQAKRKFGLPNYEKLGGRMFETYKTAKRYGY